MSLGVEAPAREDLSFRSNDDKLVGARWYKSDGATPVPITSAELALRFDAPLVDWTAHPEHPIVLPQIHTIDSTTPGDPNGWIDATLFTSGVVLVSVPHDIWPQYVMDRGVWDLIAVGESTQRCLVRGRFMVEGGVAT